MFGLSRDVPDDLAAQYPDLLLDPSEHAQLFKVKYAGVFTFDCVPARIEAMRTEQWGQLDLRTVLSLETYIDMADYDRIKTICVYGCKDDWSHCLNKITMWPIFERPFVSPEGWKSNGGLTCIHERQPDDRLYWPVVFDIPDLDPATDYANVVYTVEWRSGAVTLMPIDMVKVHLYTELPPAPRWLESYPGTTVCRRGESKDVVVPDDAVVERWYLCKKRKHAAEVFDAYVDAFMPPKFEYSL